MWSQIRFFKYTATQIVSASSQGLDPFFWCIKVEPRPCILPVKLHFNHSTKRAKTALSTGPKSWITTAPNKIRNVISYLQLCSKYATQRHFVSQVSRNFSFGFHPSDFSDILRSAVCLFKMNGSFLAPGKKVRGHFGVKLRFSVCSTRCEPVSSPESLQEFNILGHMHIRSLARS